MKKSLLAIAFTAVFTGACKKETPQPKSLPVVTESPYVFAGDGFYNGTFTTTDYYLNATNRPSYSEAAAVFYKYRGAASGYDSLLPVSAVYFNGDSLHFAAQYYVGDYPLHILQHNWAVKGSNGIPSFSFANTGKTPSGIFSKIPNTLSKAAGPVFDITVQDFTEGFISLNDESGKTYWGVDVKLHPGLNHIDFRPAVFKLGPGKAGILIELDNNTVQLVSGMKFKCTKRLYLAKDIVLLP